MQIPLNTLLNFNKDSRTAAFAFRNWLVEKGFIGDDGAFVCAKIFLVPRVRNGQPAHQDLFTGEFTYTRVREGVAGELLRDVSSPPLSPKLPKLTPPPPQPSSLKKKTPAQGGYRLLLDLGGMPDVEDDGRRMEFALVRRRGRSPVLDAPLLTTSDKLVLMDGVAAGAGGDPCNVYHSRYGSGLTFVADLVVKRPRGGAGHGVAKNDSVLYGFLRDNNSVTLHTSGNYGSTRVMGQAAAERAEAAKAAGTIPEVHCFWCALGKPPVVDFFWRPLGGRWADAGLYRLCSPCHKAIQRHVTKHGEPPADRPAAGMCGTADEQGCDSCHRLSEA